MCIFANTHTHIHTHVYKKMCVCVTPVGRVLIEGEGINSQVEHYVGQTEGLGRSSELPTDEDGKRAHLVYKNSQPGRFPGTA